MIRTTSALALRPREAVTLWTLAVLATVAIGARAPVFWDSFGYLRQSIDGQIGGLALGRPLFLLISHGLTRVWLAAGGSVWSVETWLRVWWIGLSATAAPATCALALRCDLDRATAQLAGAIVALSPALADASAPILTDAPSLAVATAMLVAGADAVRRGSLARAAVAGMLAGAAFGLREQSIVSAAGLVLMLPLAPRGRRVVLAAVACVAAAIVAAVPVGIAWTQPGYGETVLRWLAAMQRERAAHHFSLRDAAFFLAWLGALGPLGVAAAAFAWVRCTSSLLPWPSVRVAVVAPALIQLLALALYPDIAYSPRYLVAALPGAIAIPAAIALAAAWAGPMRRRVAFALVVPLVVASPVVAWRSATAHRALDDFTTRVRALPDRAVVVTGWMCPAIPLLQTQHRVDPQSIDPEAAWQPVCPGWGWPSPLAPALDAALRDGRTVVLDLRPASWIGDEQHAALAEAIAFDAAVSPAAPPALVVWR